MYKRSDLLAILIAALGLIMGLVVMVDLVPRVRLVEAISLFATAFSAGAGVAVTVSNLRRDAGHRTTQAPGSKLP